MTRAAKILATGAKYVQAVGIGAALAATILWLINGPQVAFPVAFSGVLFMLGAAIMKWVAGFLASLSS